MLHCLESNERQSFCIALFCFLKFIYSEKATKFCKIFTLLLSYVVPVKSKAKILKTFVAFSEYMNFNMWTIMNETGYCGTICKKN